ncbi:MAG TPA: hypothetical protein VGB92_26075 [Longimicrobium sp.]
MPTTACLIFVITAVIVSACSGGAGADRLPQSTVSATGGADTAAGVRAKSDSDDYESLEAAAMAGDYQAQRNLAYQLSGDAGGVPVNPILSCAWRIVIVESGSPSVNTGDTGNLEYYCNKRLGAAERVAAAAQAKRLQARIGAARDSKPERDPARTVNAS